MTRRIVRIAGASGAWGDSPMAIPQLLMADVDYFMMDYLAEVTMSLLARARLKDLAAGFPPDFLSIMQANLPEVARRGIRVVTNAGGVNPVGCKRALEEVAARLGIKIRIAAIEGDDVMWATASPEAAGIRDAYSGASLPGSMLTANAYLGALPIKAALDAGADIVITGRCADSALAVGILMHEFGWAPDDYDRLAAGSLCGHILECGPQATGGIHTDWEKIPDWHNIGYPIAECRADGSFVVSKPPATGGLIIPAVIAEQVLYEVGDPSAYLLPDVSADFSNVTLAQVGENRVEVTGARGKAPSPQYKVSATYQDGYRAIATISIVGPDASRKAERTAEALVARSRMLFQAKDLPDFTSIHVEALGAESAYPIAGQGRHTREVLLRLVVGHESRSALDVFAKEVGSIGLSFAPGTTGIFGGRPKATPLIRLFTFFMDKSTIPRPTVSIDDETTVEVAIPFATATFAPTADETQRPDSGSVETADLVEVPLLSVATARSGDKANASNIAIFARRPEFVPYLRGILTPDRLLQHFSPLIQGPVKRYEAPGLNAFNFLLENALGGGGMASPRIDPQGKAFGQMTLEMMVPVPKHWLERAGEAADDTSPSRLVPEVLA